MVIPDNVPAGVNIPVVVGTACTIADLNFRFDGTPSADANATTVGVNHSWVGDLKFTLISATGTSVAFFDRPGVPLTGAGCNSNNLAALTLDDDGGFHIQGLLPRLGLDRVPRAADQWSPGVGG